MNRHFQIQLGRPNLWYTFDGGRGTPQSWR